MDEQSVSTQAVTDFLVAAQNAGTDQPFGREFLELTCDQAKEAIEGWLTANDAPAIVTETLESLLILKDALAHYDRPLNQSGAEWIVESVGQISKSFKALGYELTGCGVNYG